MSNLPFEGQYLEPDGWRVGERLKRSDGFKDSGFPGSEYTIESGHNFPLPVNVTITGRVPRYRNQAFYKRVKIEFVRDCEPSVFSGGWILLP